MALTQCFLRKNHTDANSGINAHQYGSSHANQQIKAWWAMLHQSWSSWWINFFKDMIAIGVLDTSNSLHLECLWCCFSPVLRSGLQEIKNSCTNHYVRKSRYCTAAGIPSQHYRVYNNLFFTMRLWWFNNVAWIGLFYELRQCYHNLARIKIFVEYRKKNFYYAKVEKSAWTSFIRSLWWFYWW